MMRWMHATQFLMRRQNSGSVVIFAAVAMVALFAFAALAIEVAHYCQLKRDLQDATDIAAMAGAILLTNPSANSASVTACAQSLAYANGLATNELDTIQIGWWSISNSTFAVGGPPYNAVVVPAHRAFATAFAKILGTATMEPAVQSIALADGLGVVPNQSVDLAINLVPFGVTTDQVAEATTGIIFDGNKISPGNWGKIDLCGHNESANGTFSQDMLYGVGCTVSVGDTPNSGPGKSAFPSAFNARLLANPFVIVPVVDAFGTGKKQVTIEGFVAGMLLPNSPGDPSSGWNGQIQLLNRQLAGGGGGGPTNSPYALVRLVVQ
jgi:Flp pilus assembly protein TadG